MAQSVSESILSDVKSIKLLINGQTVDSSSYLNVVNPATGTVFAQAPEASVEQLSLAVDSATEAFAEWSTCNHAIRQEKVQRLAAVLQQHKDTLAELLTLEQGKPLAQSHEEIEYAAAFLEYFSSRPIPHRKLNTVSEQSAELHFKPLGVVGAIVPWNFPLLLSSFKIGPALVAGNCVILKTAPTTPLTTLKIAQLAAGIFPPGVLHVLAGDNELGAAMTTHPDIQKIAFTGSTATGKQVMVAAASNLKRLTLELGGNDAAVVLEDSDVSVAAQTIFATAFLNAGQTCIAVKRVYVHRSLFEQFWQTINACLQNAVVGAGNDPATTIGPVQNERQYMHIKGLLKRSLTKSSKIASAPCPKSDGYFIEPTLITNVADDSPIVAEEQFAPILPVLTFESEQNVIKRVNQSDFGLAASVWSQDAERAQALAQQIESGTVWINQHLALLPNVPLGGVKQSGLGHELGDDALEHFMAAKVIMKPATS